MDKPILKIEGKKFVIDHLFDKVDVEKTKTLWVERQVPEHLADDVQSAIDAVLAKNGFDPEGDW